MPAGTIMELYIFFPVRREVRWFFKKNGERNQDRHIWKDGREARQGSAQHQKVGSSPIPSANPGKAQANGRL